MTALTIRHITSACMFCQNTSAIEITRAEHALLREGVPIQDALVNRPAPERELIRSGIHPSCWVDAFGPAE